MKHSDGLPENANSSSKLVAQIGTTRSFVTAKSTARPSCLVGVLYNMSREKIC